ncbi:MAG: transferrin receptor-like dimerization domain-containing protein, partial [Gammaproteobacteria bacterium]
RYGQGWRGLKPQLAQEHGAVGCIIYSDPRDDGYAVNGTYPDGPARPEQGFQRGSVAAMPTYPGDPLTPGVGATASAKRIPREKAPTVLKIPVLPISYGDARHFLAALGGHVAPPEWQGGLGITYRVGGNADARARLKVKSEWSLKTIHNVVATMKGAEHPDQWVLRGNHRDGWVFGASDPLSGHIVLMAEAKAIGALAKGGWKPARTLVYLSWDAEEPMLLGSTEWVEQHAKELQQKAVAYVNTDGNGRGFLNIAGSHSLQSFARAVARDVSDPQTGVPVDERARAFAMVSADPSPRAREVAKAALEGKDLPLDPLGSGSDFSGFVHHLGIASLNVAFGGEGDDGGVYHSAYDTWEHHARFVDPGFAYAGALAKTTGRMVLRLADDGLPVMRYTPFAETVAGYIDEVRKLADTRREAQQQQAKALAAGAYRLADDPTLSRGDPTPLKPVPYFNFAPLENALEHLKTSATAYDAALAAEGASLPARTRADLVSLAARNEQRLLQEPGLPGGRGWYRNMLYAPGRLTGYGAKTLPGVREAIEDERWADVDNYTALAARALQSYADGLDEGVRMIGAARASRTNTPERT